MSETTSIRARRRQMGLTLRELADKCAAGGAPVHYSQLARIEKGLHEPRPKLASTLADVLDLSTSDFDREAAH